MTKGIRATLKNHAALLAVIALISAPAWAQVGSAVVTNVSALVTITNDTSTNANEFVMWGTSATGPSRVNVSNGTFVWNPSLVSLGLGTTPSANYTFDQLCTSTGTACRFRYKNGSNNAAAQTQMYLENDAGNVLVFALASSTAASANSGRINAGGGPLVLAAAGTDAVTLSTGGAITIAAPAAAGVGATFVCLSTTNVINTGATCAASTEIVKDDIRPLTNGCDVVKKMEPVSWTYNEKAGRSYVGKLGWGFTAERSAALASPLAIFGESGAPWSIDERAYAAALAGCEQDLIARLDAIENKAGLN